MFMSTCSRALSAYHYPNTKANTCSQTWISWVQDPGSRILDPESWIQPCILAPGFWIQKPGSWNTNILDKHLFTNKCSRTSSEQGILNHMNIVQVNPHLETDSGEVISPYRQQFQCNPTSIVLELFSRGAGSSCTWANIKVLQAMTYIIDIYQK